MKKNNSWWQTFKNAVIGCFYAFKTQKNFKVHFGISALVLIFAWWLNIPFERFLFLLLAIVFGLTIEMANTAFEKTIDLITSEFHPKAKIAKDVSAGMMLVASIGLAILATLILLPPLWQTLLGR